MLSTSLRIIKGGLTMNNNEFINLVNALESVYGVFTGLYLCHKDNYMEGFNVDFHEVKCNNYKNGTIYIGDRSKLNILVQYDDVYKDVNFIKLITENGEAFKIDLNEV